MVERHDDESHGDEPAVDETEADDATQASSGHGLPLTDDSFTGEPFGLPADQRREQTALEMMNAPGRPSERTRKSVLWIALAFASVLFSLTVGVIAISGLDILEVFTVLMLGGVIFGLIGALRYKGEDPMAQFDPPPIAKKRLGRGRRARRSQRSRDEDG